VVAERPGGWRDVPLDEAARREGVVPNREAQQPAPYYRAAALLDRAFGTTQLSELLVLRLLAVPFGVITAVATALFAARLWGRAGFGAGLLLVATPTWITLVARAGNDAPACAALAVAILLSVRPDRGWAARLAEAAAWAAAIALKLYTWPAALLLPLLWPRRSPISRRAATAAAVLASGLVTASDLAARTGSTIGRTAAWSPGGAPLTLDLLVRWISLPWLQFLKVFVGSAIWTSGEHANFLRPPGLVLFVLPWLALLAAAVISFGRMPGRARAILGVAAAVFLVAEIGQSWGYLREEAAGGASSGSAGLAGWYVHALDPIWYGVGAGFALAMLAERRLAPAAWLIFAGAFLGDLGVTEGALFRDYAGLSSPHTPGVFVRWGGGSAWAALERLRLYGLGLPSPWIAVGLRALEAAAFAALAAAVARPPADEGAAARMTV
jgi:hypothetical protein